jgi:co-chaperonin GroES (HSP10)
MSQLEGAKQMLEREGKEQSPESIAEILQNFSFIDEMLNGHLLVKIDNFQYKGKIIIPENAKRQPTKGIVVAVAADITNIKVGDRILYSQFAGYLLKFEDTPICRCLGYSEILGKLKADAPVLSVEGA